jgi:putative peptide zinc metalloprotease protein
MKMATMNRFDYCAYPPLLAPDLDLSERTEGDSRKFIAGSAAVGRYLLLGEAERQVIELLNGERTASGIGDELLRRNGSAPAAAVLTRFLGKLDEVGILAGERSGRPAQALFPGNQLYFRGSLFNPDRLFARILPALRWIWTPWFFALSALLIAGAGMLAALNWPEVFRYAGQTLQAHYLAIFIFAWLVTVSHEFAHGLTSKAFGGRATEVGGLLIYYCIPALYCNVSGLHLIAQRGRRLWVIAAGVYWQLLVGALSLIAWFLLNPDTLPASLAMAMVLGSVLDVALNANPLIKLDGYYFLSQLLRVPNLMDRSRACWRAALQKLLAGAPDPEPPRFTARERRILLVFGWFSFFYNLALPVVVVWYAAQFLMAWLYFPGLLLSLALAVAYAWRPLKKCFVKRGGDMATERPESRQRRFMPAALILCFLAVLCIPWTASVGSYGTLLAIPGREAVIRAPENASLIALHVQPGQKVAGGAVIGRMGNLDLEEQIGQLRTDMARVNADIDRMGGELRVQQETGITSEWQLAQRRREFADVEAEERQIRAARGSYILASTNPAPAPELPAALAAMEADAEQLGAKLAEVRRQRDRVRALVAEGIAPRAELDAAEAKWSALAFDLAAAQQRLNAALIEHRRGLDRRETDMNVARSNLVAGHAQAATLRLQLGAALRLRNSLDDRLALLERKRAQFALVAPVGGTVFGEDLPRMTGQFFSKGGEICRIADTAELLVRMQVAEQSLGDIVAGKAVRVKPRAFPDRVFRGVVSKIGGESELDQSGQRCYRVELTIRNQDWLLRTRMTVFARVDFGRHILAWVAGHKLKQALRPEMWML